MFADKKRLFSFAGCLLGAANKIYCLVLLATFQISSEQKLSGSVSACRHELEINGCIVMGGIQKNSNCAK